MHLDDVLDGDRHALCSEHYRASCKARLDRDGALVLNDFVRREAVASIRKEGERHAHLAYYTVDDHTIYLTPPDPDYPADHPRNRSVSSSKGCITDDQIPGESPLRVLYDAPSFRDFLCAVLGEQALHEYADPLSSINLHFAGDGQELGWHFDNSSFAITLLIQKPDGGGEFEYVKDVRDANSGEMNFAQAGEGSGRARACSDPGHGAGHARAVSRAQFDAPCHAGRRGAHPDARGPCIQRRAGCVLVRIGTDDVLRAAAINEPGRPWWAPRAADYCATPLGPGAAKNAARRLPRSTALTTPSPVRSASASAVKNTERMMPRSTALTTPSLFRSASQTLP